MSEKENQNANQMADETFKGDSVDVAKAAKFNPALDGSQGERTESTKND